MFSTKTPIWKRINYLIMSLGGCAFGFHIQDRIMEGNISKLREELPRLERELELAIMRRRSLEREVERLTAQQKEQALALGKTSNYNDHNTIVATNIIEDEENI